MNIQLYRMGAVALGQDEVDTFTRTVPLLEIDVMIELRQDIGAHGFPRLVIPEVVRHVFAIVVLGIQARLVVVAEERAHWVNLRVLAERQHDVVLVGDAI